MSMHDRIYETAGEAARVDEGRFANLSRRSAEGLRVHLRSLYFRHPLTLEIIDSVLLIAVIFSICSASGLFNWWCQWVNHLF